MRSPRQLVAGLRNRARPRATDTCTAEAPALVDPLLHYEELRAHGPVMELPEHGFWVVLSHEAAKAVMGDAERFSNCPYRAVDIALLSADPPRHAVVRRAVSPLLAAGAVERIVGFATRRADELVQSPLEIVADYARPLSRGISAELMGFSADDTAYLLEANRAADAMVVPMEAQFEAVDAVSSRAGAHEMLTRDAGDVLSADEIDSFLRLLWVASTTTSERLIAFCILRLLHDPSVGEALRDQPTLVPAFIDEVVRLHPPEPMILREAMQDTEIAGVTIPAGASVRVCLPAVNRDPVHFDEPGRLRLDRTPGRHLGFGTGPHTCIGAGLSRRTVPVAINALLRGLPELRALEPDLPPLHAYPPERLLVSG